MFVGLLKFVYMASKYRVLDGAFRERGSRIWRYCYSFLAGVFYPKRFFTRWCPDHHAHNLLSFCALLGPIYIKFGQTLSTRPDIIRAENALILKSLQDDLTPVSFDLIQETLNQELGGDLNEIFSYIDPSPVASASVAQVHKAVLRSGQHVAVKVLRPNIHNDYTKSLKSLKIVAKCIAWIFADIEKFKLPEVIEIFHASMSQELNLKLEAANCSELQDNLAKIKVQSGAGGVVLPCVYWQFTTQKVLVSSWISGVSVYHEEGLGAIDRKDVSYRLANMFFHQTYQDGFFHADLHPGNILILPNGQIALVDFGIMGRLSDRDRLGVAQILYCLLKRDYLGAARAHLNAGYVPESTDLALFAQHCRAVCEPIVGLALKDVSIGNVLGQMLSVIKAFDIQVQPQLILLQKSMLVIEGVGKTLNPDINMWQLAYSWMENWGIKNLSIEARMLARFKKFIAKEIFKI